MLAFGLASTNGGRTIVGTNNVGDNTWRHVAVTRIRTSGLVRIYVDGRLDSEGTGPTGDLGYRDGRGTAWPYSDPFLVLGAEKHDVGPAYPSYNGFLDEFRVWTQALSQAQISNVFRDVIATNTPGLAMILDGVPEATPFTRARPATNLVELLAPTNLALNGTTYVFRCWSDGGPQNRTLLVPTNGILLRAGYAAVPGGAVDAPVPESNRNVESYGGNNRFANLYDSAGLCAGRDNGGRYETALAFAVPVSPDTMLDDARLLLRATVDQSNAPTVFIRAFTTSNPAPFVAGIGASITGLYPLVTDVVAWTGVAFAPGQTVTSPALTSLLQPLLDRPDWNAGQFIGLTLTVTNTAGDHWRCFNNQQSGVPPRLLVTWSGGGDATNDIDGDGMPDDWEAQHRLDCTTSAAPEFDTDGDGVPDRAEFLDTNAAPSRHFRTHIEFTPSP